MILILLAQLVTIDKGLESGVKESKPVLLFIHRNLWKGEEKAVKDVKETLGPVAGKIVIAHVDVQEHEEVVKRYELTNLDGTLVVLDPKLKAATTQQLGRLEKDEELTPDGIKALVENALKRFAVHEACRAAIDALWAALKKGDKDALKKSLWPVQVGKSGDKELDALLAEGSKAAEMWEQLVYVSVTDGNAEKMKKLDETVEGLFKVKFDFVKGDKKDGTSMEVVQTKAGFFVVMGR